MIELKPNTYYKISGGDVEVFFKVSKESLQSDMYLQYGTLDCKDAIIKDNTYPRKDAYSYKQFIYIPDDDLKNKNLEEISYKDYLQELKVLKSELDYNYEELIRQSIKGVLDKGGEK